jgi:hypothetical protein
MKLFLNDKYWYFRGTTEYFRVTIGYLLHLNKTKFKILLKIKSKKKFLKSLFYLNIKYE